MSKLRHTGVDGHNVVCAGGLGVVLEAEKRFETTGEELVRNRSTCQWVQDKISVQAYVPQLGEPWASRGARAQKLGAGTQNSRSSP